MVEFTLTPSPVFTRPPVERGGTRLEPVSLGAVHTLSRPGDALPEVGQSATDGARLLLRPALERTYVIGPPKEDSKALDQTGFFVALRLAGPAARAVLERSWAPDLGTPVFPPGAVAQSRLGQVPAILHRESADSYLLLAPRSYAMSLFEELETSLAWVAQT